MKKQYLLLLISILTLAITSCQFIADNESPKYNYHYDTSSLYYESIKKLPEQFDSYNKEYTLNGKTESIENIKMDSADLAKELKVLLAANINLPSFADKYEVDSLKLSDDGSLIYSATSENQRVHFLRVYAVLNPISNRIEDKGVFAELNDQNFMNSFEKNIRYEFGTKLEVEGWHVSLFSDTVFYHTVLTFN